MSDMGIDPGTRQSRDGRPVVAFDFDGTLTVRDSFTAFLRDRAGKRGWARGLVRLSPAIATYARDRDRGRLKAASVREFLTGIPREALEAEAAAFADRALDGFMRPDALETWDAWGRRGALRVIVTASECRWVAEHWYLLAGSMEILV